MSRNDGRSTRLRRRPSRMVPASIVAFLLLAIGALTAVAGVWRLVNGSWPTPVTTAAPAMVGVNWGSWIVLTVAVGVAVLGVVLLLAAIVPGGYKAAQLRATGPGTAQQTDFVISNRGLARLAAATADTIDGVDGVSASATGRKVGVKVRTASREQASLIRDRVQAAVTTKLTTTGLQPAPVVRVSVQTKEI